MKEDGVGGVWKEREWVKKGGGDEEGTKVCRRMR